MGLFRHLRNYFACVNKECKGFKNFAYCHNYQKINNCYLIKDKKERC